MLHSENVEQASAGRVEVYMVVVVSSDVEGLSIASVYLCECLVLAAGDPSIFRSLRGGGIAPLGSRWPVLLLNHAFREFSFDTCSPSLAQYH
jgi:hypothetical protein